MINFLDIPIKIERINKDNFPLKDNLCNPDQALNKFDSENLLLPPNETLKAYYLDKKDVSDSTEDYFSKLYDMVLTSSDAECVRKYKSDRYFREINTFLRYGEDGFLNMYTNRQLDFDPNIDAGELTENQLKCLVKREQAKQEIPDLKRIIRGIDKVLDYSFLPKSTTVYRGVNEDIFNKIIESDEKYCDKGYVSTTYQKKNTRLFGQYVLEIDVPKGAKAINMKTLLKRVPNWCDEESELLLPRNSIFEIIEIDKENKYAKLKLML